MIVSIPTLLANAQRPLALFLEDALRSVREDCMESIVLPYINGAYCEADPKGQGHSLYWGAERAEPKDERGFRIRHLEGMDLAFLTHLFEFSVRPAETVVAEQSRIIPNLKQRLPFQSSISRQLQDLRDLRNSWAHTKGAPKEPEPVMKDVMTLWALFDGELRTILDASPDIFRSETKRALYDFVNELTVAKREGAAALAQHAPVPVPPASNHPVTAEREHRATPEEHNTWPWWRRLSSTAKIAWAGVLSLAVVFALIADGLTIWHDVQPNAAQMPSMAPVMVSQPEIRKTLVILLTEPVPPEKLDTLKGYIFQANFPRDTSLRVVIVDRTHPSGILIDTTLSYDRLQEAVVNRAVEARRLQRSLQFADLFDGAYGHMQASFHDNRQPVLMVVGSVGNFTAKERAALDENTVRLYRREGITTWWSSNHIAPPVFVYHSGNTASDADIMQTFIQKNISRTLVTL